MVFEWRPAHPGFEARLAQHCGGNTTHVATVANATMGLALALLASDLPERSLCMVPSWIFAATGHAILLAGLVPWMADVNRETVLSFSDCTHSRDAKNKSANSRTPSALQFP